MSDQARRFIEYCNFHCLNNYYLHRVIIYECQGEFLLLPIWYYSITIVVSEFSSVTVFILHQKTICFV